jgi:hypothetical protein
MRLLSLVLLPSIAAVAAEETSEPPRLAREYFAFVLTSRSTAFVQTQTRLGESD